MNTLKTEIDPDIWFLSLTPEERLRKGLEWGLMINKLQEKTTGRNLMLERFAEEVEKTWNN